MLEATMLNWSIAEFDVTTRWDWGNCNFSIHVSLWGLYLLSFSLVLYDALHSQRDLTFFWFFFLGGMALGLVGN